MTEPWEADASVFGEMPPNDAPGSNQAATITNAPDEQLTHRFWSPTSFLLLQGALFVFGLILGLLALLDGEFLPALIGLVMAGWAAFSFGWVDIEPGVVSQEKIGRKTTTRGEDVLRIELDYTRSKSTKWWYPVLITTTSDEVHLTTLRSVSKKKTAKQARIIEAALRGEDIFVSPAQIAANGGVVPPPGPQIDPDVFTPLPGLERHYER